MMRPRSVPWLALVAVGASVVVPACGPATPDATAPGGSAGPSASVSAAPVAAWAIVRFAIPRGGEAVDPARTPWPTELARKGDGRLDFRAYPGGDSALVAEYLARASEDLDGFSIAPVVSFRIDGAIDAGAVAVEDVGPSARSAVALVDVDPASPEKGTFRPLAMRFTARDMRYEKAGTLAVRPLDGFALRPGTLYAAVLRRSPGVGGRALAPAPDLEAVLSKTARADAVEERARALHAPAVDALEALGIGRAEIAGLAVFRTGRPHVAAEGIVAAVDALFAKGATAPAGKKLTAEEGAALAPRILSASWDDKRTMVHPIARALPAGMGAPPPLYRVITGTYCTPSFQSRVENAPFLEREGGRVAVDGEGRPTIAPVPASAPFASAECPGQLRARFALSVPGEAMPKDGFPLVVSAHGTGGDVYTFLGERDHAGFAARAGFAVVATDQPLHGHAEGGRPGATGPLVLPMGIPVPADQAGPELAFYNPLYPGAARGNMHQAQADAAVLVRLFGGLDLGALVDRSKRPVLAARKGDAPPRFDARRTALAGHSQGCQSMAVLGAIDPRARGVLLSGCGGDVRLGILYRRVMALAPWIAMTLGLDPDELSPFHPLLALVQNLADPIDPLAFARYYWDPLPGRRPQRVLHIQGLRDGYNPEAASGALAVALRASALGVLKKPIAGMSLLAAPAGSERVVAQFAPPGGKDGHFVLYDEPAAGMAFTDALVATPSAP